MRPGTGCPGVAGRRPDPGHPRPGRDRQDPARHRVRPQACQGLRRGPLGARRPARDAGDRVRRPGPRDRVPGSHEHDRRQRAGQGRSPLAGISRVGALAARLRQRRRSRGPQGLPPDRARRPRADHVAARAVARGCPAHRGPHANARRIGQAPPGAQGSPTPPRPRRWPTPSATSPWPWRRPPATSPSRAWRSGRTWSCSGSIAPTCSGAATLPKPPR